MYAFDLEVKLDQLLVKVGKKVKLKELSLVVQCQSEVFGFVIKSFQGGVECV